MNKKGFALGLPKGFTLIEIMVVMSIIGILMALTLTGINSSRKTARDARRKADLEMIRSGLEIYKADCDAYPTTGSIVGGSPLIGTFPPTPPTSCAAANTYISIVPTDPVSLRFYRYAKVANGYEICTSLEQTGLPTVTCSGFLNCGVGHLCNYKVKNP